MDCPGEWNSVYNRSMLTICRRRLGSWRSNEGKLAKSSSSHPSWDMSPLQVGVPTLQLSTLFEVSDKCWPLSSALTCIGLADTLRSELLLYGIDVHIYMPAGILTPGFETESMTKPKITQKIEEGDTPITADVCADLLYNGRYPWFITRAGMLISRRRAQQRSLSNHQ